MKRFFEYKPGRWNGEDEVAIDELEIKKFKGISGSLVMECHLYYRVIPYANM